MSNAETTASKQRVIGKPFQPGQSGNPKGRPVGSRHKLQEDFLRDLAASWQTFGAAALEQCAREEPSTFCRIVAGLMPKQAEVDINVDILHRTTDIVNAFRLASDLLGTDATSGVKRLRRLQIDHES